MYRRLKLCVTWGIINNSSCDISLLLFNLCLQKYIIDVLEFPSLCHASGYCTTKRHNKEKERVTSHLPLVHPNAPFHLHPPSQAACSEGSIPMIAPTQTLSLLPPLKVGEFDPQTTSDRTQNTSEKKLWMEWDPYSVRRKVTKRVQHLWGFLIQLRHFTLPIEASLPYG